jgi:dienelactone hydrolase
MMRPFEIVFATLTLAATALLLLRLRSRLPFQVACLLLLPALAFQVFFEGPHWQLYPLYFAAFLILISCILGHHWRPSGVYLISIATLLLVCSSILLSWIMPMFRLPKASGQYAVGTTIIHLVDTSRTEESGSSPTGKRELMVQAWYPVERPAFFAGHLADYQRRKEVTLRASYRSVLKTNSFKDAAIRPGGPYPILLYNPSWMGERTEGTFQMEELASHGFVVIGVDHTFFGGLVEFPDGRVEDSHGAPDLGSFEHSTLEQQWTLGAKYVRIEAQDDIFVLDQFQAMNQDQKSPWFHKLDMARVGAMGFSIGGAVAEQMAYQDSRVKAALDMDGWSFGDVGIHGLTKPLMVIFEDKRQTVPTYAELHSDSAPERMKWQFSQQDFDQLIAGFRKNGGFLLFIEGTRHVDFSDRSLLSPLRSLTGAGTLAPERSHTLINAYTLAFFSRYLNGQDEALLVTSPAPFPEVEIEHFVAGRP